ncbi:uncharacterized protein LOC127711985 [Mytilus californianus]|uniref:uncharacterized protein LOC127711985 n=1 Tax=Mytilus californianus TaxID=6549 RepID=UPI002248278A|nr:uncharacterized protein LOC127711985 [Mytilus californianus]
MAEFKLDTGQTSVEDIQPKSNNYCGPCETRLVTRAPKYWCNSCKEGLCAEFFEHHKAIKASRSHITVEFTKFMKLKPFIATIETECKIHGLPFELYCPNHEATCCSFCATLDHSTCLGLKSLPNVVATFRESEYLNHLDQRFDVLVNNIDKIIENRASTKKTISYQLRKSRSDIQTLRKEINTHLDNLEIHLASKSDKIIEDETKSIEKIPQKLEEKKRNVNQLRNNFTELKRGGTNLQVFISSKQIDKAISKEGESLNSVMAEEKMSELNLKFTLDPNLKDSIGQLLDVHLEKDKSTVILDSSTNLSCQIVSEDVTKVTAILQTNFDKSVFQKTSNVTSITIILPEKKIVVADFDNDSIFVFCSDGSILKSIRFNSSISPFGVACIDKGRFAVSFPYNCTIKIFETTDYTEVQAIELKNYCWGIQCVNNLIIVASKRKEILLLDLSGNVVKIFQADQNNLIYVHTFKDVYFCSELEQGCVNCYHSLGTKLWQFKSENTKGPRTLCPDAYGNLFVACKDSNSVVVISKDGKQSKVVLNVTEPKSVYFDIRNSILYVCSQHGNHFSSHRILHC